MVAVPCGALLDPGGKGVAGQADYPHRRVVEAREIARGGRAIQT